MENELRIRRGDRCWPIAEMIMNTWIDDLTKDRIQEVVRLLDSFRITDVNGKLLNPQP